ncbi:hypothetical protein Pla22_29930 [Rubripirellula amarantea]|uniref:Tetratricopeptide repeat protein n=1 Tax=Rubripirellula amarantea TaxID=2527999 RepID=A0A5C5WK72_9BACT|nr:hypothetical protein Pla22_29930 [Rubripirellula amarantea]
MIGSGRTRLLLAIAFVSLLGGCARSVATIADARMAFASGDLPTAQATLEPIAKKRGRNRDAASLDLAMVKLAAGEVHSAEQTLRELRDRFDQAPKLSLAHDAASTMTDDNTRVFRPASHEEVMIRAMLSICSLARDGTDAEAYALQATTKQDQLRVEAEARGIPLAANHFQPIALAPYLRGVLREATHHDYDDAAKAYQLVSAVQPQFAPAGEDIERATTGAHSAPGHGVLYVIACVGEGPRLEETTAPTTSAALSIASVVLNAQTNQGSGNGDQENGPVLPNIAQVKVPRVVVPPSNLAAINVKASGAEFGVTQTLTDVGQLAISQNEAEMPWTIARAVTRRVVKETTVAKVTDSIGLDGSLGSLFHFAAASAWSGVEKADTRCWGLLPREIQVLRCELPEGNHPVELQAVNFHGIVSGMPRIENVTMVNGRNTYLIVIAPRNAIYVVRSQ